MDDCLFCKIVSGEIPSAKVYEDDVCYAFDDIEPERRCTPSSCRRPTTTTWPPACRPRSSGI
ncbi:MAG: HIT family protein [Adlercreutzia equolifaciens]